MANLEPGEIAAIFAAVRDGDRTAWRRLVDHFSPTLWAVARLHRLSASDAADVVQATWLKLIEKQHTIEQPAFLKHWLARTAQRESLDRLRAGKRQVPTEPDELPEGIGQRDDNRRLAQAERDLELWEAFGELNGECQRLLQLTVLAEAPPSYAQVSRETGRPVGALGPTRRRCLDRLRELLGARAWRPSLEDLD